jgi:hypothetical protein
MVLAQTDEKGFLERRRKQRKDANILQISQEVVMIIEIPGVIMEQNHSHAKL